MARVEATLKLAQLRRDAMQQEQALRLEAEAARQQVETILSSIRDGFYLLDRGWRFVYANDHLCEMVGMQREAILGQSVWDLFPDAVGTEVYIQFHRAMSEQTPLQFEYLYLTWGRWYEYRVYPSPDGLTIFTTDISALKQAESALRQSESRFRLIVESAKEYAIFTLDLNGIVTSWNSGAERVLGYQEAEIVGCSKRIIYTPEDNAWGRAEWEMQTALTKGQATNECWHMRKDGNRFWGSGVVMPLQDEADNLQGFITIMRDMTEPHQAAEREQFLAEASAALTTSLNYKTTLTTIARLAVPFLADYCFFDIVNANQQIERVAWHIAEPTMQDWFNQVQRFVPPQNFENHLVASALESGNANVVPEVTEAWMQAAAISAQELQFMRRCQLRSLMTVPLKIEQHQLGALTFCFTTNSNRRYTQTELAVAEELGRRAALALDNARLYHQAQETNRLKDEFLAVLSHELRSPLNPILGWTKLLQSGRLDAAKTAQALATIERNAKLQTELIEDLLDVSRILQGKLSLNIRPVDLVLTVEAAIETVILAAQAKTIEIQTILDGQIGQVLGDSSRLQQIVWNLVSNAVKFTPPGGRVEVRLSRFENPDQITVTDTGKGINPEFLPHVFDYFRQEDSATTRKFGGLGLGLAIVRHLVELHGGTVQADSPGEGQGATFTVRLPLPATEQQQRDEQRLFSFSNAAQPLLGRRVLLVDDETDY